MSWLINVETHELKLLGNFQVLLSYQVFAEKYLTLIDFLLDVVIILVGYIRLVIEQVVIDNLEFSRYNIFMSFVHFYYSVVLKHLTVFLINPAINVCTVKHENDKLLIKLNHFFSRRPSDMDIFQNFHVNVLIVILEEKLKFDVVFALIFEKV